MYMVVGGLVRYYDYLNQLDTYKQEVEAAGRTGATNEQRQQAEGKDERNRNAELIAAYRVGPTEPRVLRIDKLGLEARVLPMATNKDGSIQAPINIFDAGWYTGSAKPGTPGATIIDGHASGPSRLGLFAYLDTLVAGDRITVERGDGQIISYRVTGKQSIPLDQVDMSRFLHADENDEMLHMITCGGKWLANRQTYNERIVVSAERMI